MGGAVVVVVVGAVVVVVVVVVVGGGAVVVVVPGDSRFGRVSGGSGGTFGTVSGGRALEAVWLPCQACWSVSTRRLQRGRATGIEVHGSSTALLAPPPALPARAR